MSHRLGVNYYVNFLGHLGSNEFQLKGAVLELPAKQHCQKDLVVPSGGIL